MTQQKPSNCECYYPGVTYRNDSKHAIYCPVYREYTKLHGTIRTKSEMRKVIVILIHDRHTDDKIRVLDYSEESIEKAKAICRGSFSAAYNNYAVENKWEGDWCWFIGEDYYAYYVVKEIE
jgi:hypothetical protein